MTHLIEFLSNKSLC